MVSFIRLLGEDFVAIFQIGSGHVSIDDLIGAADKKLGPISASI